MLVNWTRHTVNSSEKVTDLKRDENGTIKENLLIKGNNLLALHTLKKQFRNKIKLIYIDPPYNTGTDSFKYNDRFNHSTWLTFMKNRLEVAKELLRDDGLFFVQISQHEFGYLKVLIDEIFPKFICNINVLVRHPERILKKDKDYHDVIEYIFVFSKTNEGRIAKEEILNDLNDYIYKVSENGAGKKIFLKDKDNLSEKQITIFEPGEFEIIKTNSDKKNLKKISIRGSLKEGNSSGRLYMKYIDPNINNVPTGSIFKIDDMGNDESGSRYFYLPDSGKSNGGYFQGVPINWSEDDTRPYPNFLDLVKEYNNVGYEGGIDMRNAKKPEYLMKKVMEIAGVKSGDIILDYHAGTGTTGAVAHKMGLQWILVEQMDYIKDLPEARLKKVLEGEQGGISKVVSWHGGGDFIYCELAKYNETFMEKIQNLDTHGDAVVASTELLKIWEEMKEKAFLDYRVETAKFDSEDFKNLSLVEQKTLLVEVLDKNQLYVNYTEMDDVTYNISKEDKDLTNLFYGK